VSSIEGAPQHSLPPLSHTPFPPLPQRPRHRRRLHPRRPLSHGAAAGPELGQDRRCVVSAGLAAALALPSHPLSPRRPIPPLLAAASSHDSGGPSSTGSSTGGGHSFSLTGRHGSVGGGLGALASAAAGGAHGGGLTAAGTFCSLPRGDNLATVIERFSTHVSEENSREESKWSPRRMDGGAGVGGTPRSGGGGGGTARSEGANQPLLLTEEDEDALREALERSTRHLNGVPCFLLQAFRSYNRKLVAPSQLWSTVLSSLERAAAATATSSPEAAIAAAAVSAPVDLFDDLMVRVCGGAARVARARPVPSRSVALTPSSSSLPPSLPSPNPTGARPPQRPGAALPRVPPVPVLQALRQHAPLRLQPARLLARLLRVAQGERAKGKSGVRGGGRTNALPSLHSQAQFHSFLRTQPLGRGGYGMVFAAQKADSGKLYAIKCMGE
jgi:hypothetical protein